MPPARLAGAFWSLAAGPSFLWRTTRPTASIGEVSLRALFLRVAAVVHHGGAGTTTLAALAGAPQIVIPQRYDQHYWAQRVQHLGLGTAHAGGTPTADSLTTALQQVLQPEVALLARSASGGVRSDGALIAAHQLINTDERSSLSSK